MPLKRPASKRDAVQKRCKTEHCKHAEITAQVSQSQVQQGPNLRLFMKSYHGLEDYHLPLLQEAQKFSQAKCVFYPGCFRHITASVVFPDVVYLDFDDKVEPLFYDDRVLSWVQDHKIYKQGPRIRFFLQDFRAPLPKTLPRSFDMLISMSSGIVSESCSRYLRRGGYVLASDAHFEARLLAAQPELYKLVAVYDTCARKFQTKKNVLDGHFKTAGGALITTAQVMESIEKPKAKRSFKLQVEGIFYLFKKL